jgi:two-component sensor histidine kinase
MLVTMLITALPFVLVTALSSIWFIPQLEGSLRQRQGQLISAVGSQVQAYLDTARSTVLASAWLANEHRDWQQLDRLLSVQVSASTVLKLVYLLDRNGIVRSLGLRQQLEMQRKDFEGLDFSRNKLYVRARDSLEIVWSDVFMSAISGELAVALAWRHFDSVVVGEVDLSKLGAYLKQLSYQAGDLVLVLDQNGQIIADQDGIYTAQQLNVANIDFIRQGMLMPTAHSAYFKWNSQALYGTISRVPSMSWYVLTAMPQEQAMATLFTFSRIIIIGLLAGLVFGLLMAGIFSHKAAMLFRTFVQKSQAIAAKNYHIIIPNEHVISKISEFQQLEAGLMNMAAEIQEREQALLTSIEEISQGKERINNALAEREVLIRELYHRTKNNMQVIQSLLTLYGNRSQNPELIELTKTMEHKIMAMSLVHQMLYQSNDLSHIYLNDYLAELIKRLGAGYDLEAIGVELVLNLRECRVLMDVAIPCGLVINELFTNTIKHAQLPPEQGRICLNLDYDDFGLITLVYSDNGQGLADGANLPTTNLGLRMVLELVQHQIGGDIKWQVRQGLSCVISFRDEQYSPRV